MRSNSRMTTAVHALCWLELSTRRGRPTLTSAEIADSLVSHPVLVRRTLAPLREADLLTVVGRGPGAGWRLTRPAARITLRDVHEALGETEAFGPHAHPPKQDCPVGFGIPDTLADVYREVEHAVARTLAGHTVAAVLDRLLEEHPLPARVR